MASLYCIEDNKYQCEYCLGEAEGFEDKERRIVNIKARKWCNKVYDKVLYNAFQKVFFYTCPANFYDAYVRVIMKMHKAYEKGLLPFPGCFNEQPNKIIEAFSVIDQYIYDKMRVEQEKQKQAKARDARKLKSKNGR